MKNIKLLITFFCITLISCSTNENEEEIPQTGEHFGIANQLQLYFSSDTENDLLDLKNNTILPATYEESYIPTNFPPITNTLRYFYSGGEISFDSQIQKYYWNTLITGKQGYKNNKIYVRISEKDIDTLDVKFKYTKGALGGGNGYYPYIEKLYYNGTLILEEIPIPGNIKYNDRVFIQKKGNKTMISFPK